MPNPSITGLPNLVIAGVTKAGTTSLHRYLGQHPDVGLADLKEVDHYAPMVHGAEPPSLQEYAHHFRDCVDSPWRMEASPRYFLGGKALISRLAEDLDRPRVVVAVREPVSRMWSSYTYKRSKDRLPAGMSFAGFVAACEKVAEQRLVRDEQHAMYRTLASGVYAEYLPDWFDLLGDDVRVVFFDDLASRPAEVTVALCDWLGIDAAPVADMDFEVRNATAQPRSQALRKAALAVNARLNRAVGEDSALKRGMRSSYQRLNAGRVDVTLADEDRERVRAFYAPTLPPLHELLSERGYRDMPGWLAGVDA